MKATRGVKAFPSAHAQHAKQQTDHAGFTWVLVFQNVHMLIEKRQTECEHDTDELKVQVRLPATSPC